MMKKKRIWMAFFSLLLTASALSAKDYNASLFGIKSDGITLNTRSIQRAIDFISEQGGGTLNFYVGRYLTGSIALKSGVSIHLSEGAALVAVPSAYDYDGTDGCTALIYADGQQEIAVFGQGRIEGNGEAVSDSIAEQIRKGFLKGNFSEKLPALIFINKCNRIRIEGIRLDKSANVPVVVRDSHEATIDRVEFFSSPEKAISLSRSESIRITDCFWRNSRRSGSNNDATLQDMLLEEK